MSIGVVSAGWYAILTGVTLVFVAYLLGSVSPGDDGAAPFVALLLGLVGVWQVERGLRAELQRRPEPPGEVP